MAPEWTAKPASQEAQWTPVNLRLDFVVWQLLRFQREEQWLTMR
jgi:hypothetical protein